MEVGYLGPLTKTLLMRDAWESDTDALITIPKIAKAVISVFNVKVFFLRGACLKVGGQSPHQRCCV